MYGKMFRAGRARRAFTLVEIILVTVIIMILVGVVGPRLTGRSAVARENATKIQMHSIRGALQEFEIHASRFPTQSEGLEALIRKPSSLSDSEWAGPYLEDVTVPKDKFGNEFRYVIPSERGFQYDLISAGIDRQFGTPDDIVFPEDKEGSNL